MLLQLYVPFIGPASLFLNRIRPTFNYSLKVIVILVSCTVISSRHTSRRSIELLLVQLKGLNTGNHIVQMTLNVHYVSSYYMNLSLLLVDIHFVVHVCISLWTMVRFIFLIFHWQIFEKKIFAQLRTLQVTSVLCAGQSYLLVLELILSGKALFNYYDFYHVVLFKFLLFTPLLMFSVQYLTFICCCLSLFSVTLNNIIQKNFPEEYAERKSEQESLTHLGVDIMPLFVMDVVLPCQKMSLNIFEPRYRLMVCDTS